jgi:DNA mismatch repair protein MutH
MITPYDKTKYESIFEYSKQLIEHTLRDFAPDAEVRLGKGGFGQLVEELYFGYNLNSDANPDFKEAGLELKTTPLKLSGTGDYLIKERLVCGMINYCEDYDKSFEQSHFFQKCILMLILFYLHQQNVSQLDLKFIYSLLWRIPKKDLLIMENDYKVIVGKILSGDAHHISEGDTMYLGACRKGQKGDPLQRQPFSDEGALKRAWCLKTSYMRTLLDFIKNSGERAVTNVKLKSDNTQLVGVNLLKNNSFEDVLLSRFKGYYGKSYNSLLKRLNRSSTSSKGKYANVASWIASNRRSISINSSEEFRKAGILLKTIRIQKNGMIKEHMSFENIDYQEIYECDEWNESRLFELFSSRYFFVIFKETDRQIRVPSFKSDVEHKYRIESEYVVDDAFFWTMPQEDLAIAEQYWENIREQVCNGRINDGAFWKASEDRNFHVRPKAKNSKDLTVDPITGTKTAKKLCYWFNNEYVLNIIKRHTHKYE